MRNEDHNQAAVAAYAALPADSAQSKIVVQVLGVLGFALLTALGAQMKIFLPGTPVPMTLQSLAVMLAGITLGARLGTISIALYLLLGIAGAQIFASSNFGLQTIIGPSGGYLIGYALAQSLFGGITRTTANRKTFRILLALLAGNGVIYAVGLVWLHVWMGQSVTATLAAGLLPFVLGDSLKFVAAFGAAHLILPKLRRTFE